MSAMRFLEGATTTFARALSGIPLERRRCDAPACTEAASMALEGRQRAVDLVAGLLDGVRRTHPTGKSVVDVLVDRLRDLRIHRRHRASLRLLERLEQLGRVRDRLLDVRRAVRVGDDGGLRELQQERLLEVRRRVEVRELQGEARILRVRADHAVVATEDAGLAAALERRERGDLVLALDLAAAGVVGGVRVGPVAHEAVLAAGPGLVGL